MSGITGAKETPKSPVYGQEITDSWFSEGMLKRYGWVGGAILSLGASVMTAGRGGDLGAGRIITYATSAFMGIWCLSQAWETRNYDSSSEIARYRGECSRSSLLVALDSHGKEIFSRGLLTPEEVREKYEIAESASDSIPAMEILHERVARFLQAADISPGIYTIPDPKRKQPQLQHQCKGMSWEEIESKHSLSAIFSWELLSPSDFKEKSRAHMEYLYGRDGKEGIRSVIRFYEKVWQERNCDLHFSRYILFSPDIFRKRWYSDLKGMNLQQFVSHCDLASLIKYRIPLQGDVSEVTEIVEAWNQVQKSYEQATASLEETYREKQETATDDWKRAQNTIAIARNQFRQKYREVENRIASLEREIGLTRDPGTRERLTSERNALVVGHTTGRLYEGLISTEPKLEENLNRAREKYEQALRQIEREKKSRSEEVRNRFVKELELVEKRFAKFASKQRVI